MNNHVRDNVNVVSYNKVQDVPLRVCGFMNHLKQIICSITQINIMNFEFEMLLKLSQLIKHSCNYSVAFNQSFGIYPEVKDIEQHDS